MNATPLAAHAPGAPAATRPLQDEANRLNLGWLIRLRWAAIVGQSCVILLSHLLWHVDFPYATLAGVLGVEMLTNAALALWARQPRDVGQGALGLVLLMDIGFLSSLLYWTGGVDNPFSFLFLIHVALASLVLRGGWIPAIGVACVVCYATLLVLADDQGRHWILRPDARQLETVGTLAAFVVTALVIAFFVSRIQRALMRRDAELGRIREAQLRSEKLASLATLAAGAAHEFATPLSTIAVIAGELQCSLELAKAEPALIEDATLIRQQVERCREILRQMSAHAGEPLGEVGVAVTADDLAEAILEGVRERGRVQVDTGSAGPWAIEVPLRAFAQACRGLVNNALQASSPEQMVRLEIAARTGAPVVSVHNLGPAIPAEVLERIGEPFFTTKAPGQGMGLGVFLARSVAEKLGGELVIISSPSRGTEARIALGMERLVAASQAPVTDRDRAGNESSASPVDRAAEDHKPPSERP